MLFTAPPTHTIDFACNAHLASPLPLASCLYCSPFLSSLSFAIQTPRHKPCRCHAIHLPLPPDNMCAPLDTGQVVPCTLHSTPCQLNVPAREIHSSELQLFIGSLALFLYVFICLVSLFRLIAPFLSFLSFPFCHRTSTTAAPFDLTLAVAP